MLGERGQKPGNIFRDETHYDRETYILEMRK